MSQGILTLNLARDGTNTPWGFRLQGGSDLGQPLTIQRVFLGSPSEGELHRGDIILRIGDRDANRLTHREAHDVIVRSGNNLKLVVKRVSRRAQSPASTPNTPNPADTGHPLANVFYQPKPTDFVSVSTPRNLLTTNMTPEYQPHYITPQNFADYEQQEYFNEQRKEHETIQHQPYRTVQLVFPKAKPRHDIPIGSYLKHVHDPLEKKSSSSTNRVNEAKIMAKLKESAKLVGLSHVTLDPGQTSISDTGPSVSLQQYNTPINMYSKQTIADTLQGQTGIHLGLTSSGIKPGTKIQTPADITLSPTYMLLQEEGDTHVKEHKPIHQELFMAHPSKNYGINAFGMPKDRINQSGSFNKLMTTLLTTQRD
ncbi:PDZ and LIM domain protein 3-like [Tachypleus tridentatus]|uniref:PDZ and LIM domain protein 3-like n=1 Tax=Tachypleus tridentatus TaxID=6853 RepID=UPI003FD16B2A